MLKGMIMRYGQILFGAYALNSVLMVRSARRFPIGRPIYVTRIGFFSTQFAFGKLSEASD